VNDPKTTSRVGEQHISGVNTIMTMIQKSRVAVVLLAGAVFASPGAAFAGCATGAAVGGVAGHMAGHHALLGAAAGCALGHHHAVEKKRAEQAQAAAHQAPPASAPH
jgi:hypothetical protein